MSTPITPELQPHSAEEYINAEMARPPSDYSRMTVGERLEIIRRAMDMDNVILARAIGTSESGWNNWKTGRHTIPVPFAIRLCQVTGATLDFIYRGIQDSVSNAFAEKLRKIENSKKSA